MNSYTMHRYGTARQHDHLARAAKANEVRQARRPAAADRGATVSDVPAHRPFAWLRDAAASFTDRLITRSQATHGSH